MHDLDARVGCGLRVEHAAHVRQCGCVVGDAEFPLAVSLREDAADGPAEQCLGGLYTGSSTEMSAPSVVPVFNGFAAAVLWSHSA